MSEQEQAMADSILTPAPPVEQGPTGASGLETPLELVNVVVEGYDFENKKTVGITQQITQPQHLPNEATIDFAWQQLVQRGAIADKWERRSSSTHSSNSTRSRSMFRILLGQPSKHKNRSKMTSGAPGNLFAQFLDSIYVGKPLKIIETGCMRDLAMSAEFGDGWSTLYIARWAKTHPGTVFETVDLSINAIELAREALKAEKLEAYCRFHCQDSLKFLNGVTWADFCFLDSCDGLQHGLDEFRLAMSTGAKLIVMDDYQTKAAWAVAEAKKIGWTCEHVNRYSVLRRPH